MRIVVFIKQVPESEDVKIDRLTNTMKREGIRMVMNPSDSTALAAAVQLKKEHGGKVIAVTMGTKKAVEVLNQAAICGADELYMVSDPLYAGSDTYATALVLSETVKYLGGLDIALCGRRAIDGETGQVGPELSVFLDIPCVTNVLELQLKSDGRVRYKRLLEDEILDAELSTPALFAVCEGIVRDYVPSISDLRRARDIKIINITDNELKLGGERTGLAGSLTTVRRTFQQTSPDRKCVFVDAKEGAKIIIAKATEAIL
ncbi:MAG TPA: electron transfer flavoprotein subunit beta/FixA family protein [Bacillota bacterium]|nr:electron transfer flavoprotein subunit beta/FixA family protein [Bacillota bacterium]HQJ36791.1 electron transfer flavoprotein subunit beta/FixA family protein [Bacillota bacterium]